MTDKLTSTPELLPPERLKPPMLSPQALAAVLVVAASVGGGYLAMTGEATSNTGGSHGQAPAAHLADYVNSNRGPGMFVPLPSDDGPLINAAIATLVLNEAMKKQVRDAVSKDTLRLGAITVWDFMDNDGDIVSVNSGGVTQMVPIHNVHTVVVLPYSADLTARITGEVDGQGGITVAAATGNGKINLRPLMVGETIMVPLR